MESATDVGGTALTPIVEFPAVDTTMASPVISPQSNDSEGADDPVPEVKTEKENAEEHKTETSVDTAEPEIVEGVSEAPKSSGAPSVTSAASIPDEASAPKDLEAGDSNDGSSGEEESEEDIVVRPRSRAKRSTISKDEEDLLQKKAKLENNSEGEIRPTMSSSLLDRPVSNDDDDEEGNTKVDEHGALKGDRKYTSKAFQLPTRGETYYFLATEIARVSGYRDSYLLFNKNRNLRKLMTTEAEKAFLIQQELIPYSYRNRQIGVVKALSIYKTFGAKVIVKGLRVKDDYFAQRARDQGFTQDDYANEEDRPVEDRMTALHDAQRRADTDAEIIMVNNAKSAVEYNQMINEQRKSRVEARLQHFQKIARKV